MGISERKERERAELRLRILEAAKQLFLEQGFEKTSIRNIADAVEYSAGTIYLHFKDKNELLLHLQIDAFKAFGKKLSQIIPEKPVNEQLFDVGKNYIEFAISNPELYELMFVMEAPMEALECQDEKWEDGLESFDFLRSLVLGCQAEGFLTQYAVDDASLYIWSFMHGLVTLKSKKRLEMFGDSELESADRMNRAFEIFYKQLMKK